MAALMLVGALALDIFAGEPPAAVHPVVWMGKLIDFFERHAPSKAGARLLWGSGLIFLGVVLSFGSTWLALRLLAQLWSVAAILAGMLLLKLTFAVTELGHQALAVRRQLASGQLGAARRETQQLVSRSTTGLAPRQLMAATIESVAENAVDSVVAPLFWFLVLGVPGAMAYRFVNTADAMIGYHGEYEHLGKAAARVDDALNWLPARLCLALMVVASWILGLKANRAWRTAARYHQQTESPNAGLPMAAAAGALAVPLEKVGHYRLGDDPARHLIPRKISDAVGLMYVTALLAAGIVAWLQLATPLKSLPWLAA